MNFSTRAKRRGLTDINLTPLVDIVFILLIFFLITSTFVQSPGIDVNLPKANSSGETNSSQSIIITVDENGQLIYGGEVTDIGSLTDTLNKLYRVSQPPNRSSGRRRNQPWCGSGSDGCSEGGRISKAWNRHSSGSVTNKLNLAFERSGLYDAKHATSSRDGFRPPGIVKLERGGSYRVLF